MLKKPLWPEKVRAHKSFYPQGKSGSKNHERFNCILQESHTELLVLCIKVGVPLFA